MDKDLISWKTNAWKNPEMVAWYHKRMLESRGTNRLKNEVEVSLCRRYVTGCKLLDVGIGTGRASLPLAREGFDVTGVDSSEAMLEQTRRLAGDTPIRLQRGDLADLAFADGEFDSLLSLNVMVHFPHWRDILKEWRRVVRAGGRIVFDIHSQDHEDVARAARGFPEWLDNTTDFGNYVCRIRVAELVEAADELGLTLVGVIPYAGLFAGGNPNLWFTSTQADGLRFDRLLSWLASDTSLLDFALFLEQTVFARLTSVSTGRMMVVLEPGEGRLANQAWLERNRALDHFLAGTVDYDRLATRVREFDSDWRQQLNGHLDWPRNRVLLHALLSAWQVFPGHLDVDSFIEERHALALQAWRRQDTMDQLATHIPRDLAALPEVAGILSHRGVPLTGGLEYDLTRDLLDKTFHAFDRGRA